MTVRSMTGFGRSRGPLGSDWMADLTGRSVNHRFLDVTIRLREGDAELEPVLRRAFSRRLARGKVDVVLRLTPLASAASGVRVDERLLESLLSRLRDLSARYPVKGELAARDLVAIPQLLSVDSPSDGFTPEHLAALERLADEVAGAMVAMREAEGRLIASELADRVALLERKRSLLESRRDEIVRAIAATLRERVRTLFPDVPIDPGRLEQEAALSAERSDVAEELQRLAGHLEQFRDLLEKSTDPVGKKLDFLSQEILREVNTLGSKARDLTLVREVLEMKAETEKIREQVQNIE